ncbi:MAG: sigma-70 family RNA polymerase sigma factor [Pirellulaceae bacterium]
MPSSQRQMPLAAAAPAETNRLAVVSDDARADGLQLAVRLASGCEQAWQQFVQRYAGLVRSRVARVAATCGSVADASLVDDMVAEVFSALLQNDAAALRAYSGRSSLGTYVSVIAARVTIRKAMGRPVHQTISDAVSEQASDQSLPETEAIDREQIVRLRELIAELPKKQREIVSLFHLEGQSYEQISRQLKIPMGSIGPTLKRAEAKLRARLES